MDKLSSLLQKSANYSRKKFYSTGPWSRSKKLYGRKFTHSFFVSYTFSKRRKIMLSSIHWSSLQIRVSKFTPKRFYEIGSSIQSIITMLDYDYKDQNRKARVFFPVSHIHPWVHPPSDP